MNALPFELTRLNARDRTGEHYLTIAGDDWTRHARDLVVEFREQAGGSRLTFTSREPMERLLSRPLQLWVGEGEEMRELFTGRLARPMPDPPTFTSAAVGLGPVAQMAENSVGVNTDGTTTEIVDYTGTTRRLALQDIISRAGYAQGTAEIRGNLNQVLGELVFNEEVSLLEAATQVNGEFAVMTDTGNGKRLFLEKPRAGSGRASGIEFSEQDYGAFTVEDVYPTTFKKVVVIKRDDAEGGNFRASVPVPQQPGVLPAPANRIKYILDFTGTDEEALQHAYDIAQSIALGEVKWSVAGLDLRYVDRYTHVIGYRNIERTDGRYREEYQLTTDEGATYNVPEWKMEMGGFGVMRGAVKIGALRILDFGPTAAVLKTRIDLVAVSGTRSTSWNVNAPRTGTRGTSWTVNAPVSGTRGTSWQIEGLAAVTGTRGTSWSINAPLAGTRATSWQILAGGAAPTLQGTPGVSAPAANSTNIPVVMPTGATILANDLLVAVIAMDGDFAGGYSGLPAGWAAVVGSAGLDGTVGVTWKRAAGGETGFTITSDTDRYMCRTFLVRGADPSGTPIAIAFANGTGAAPNPPNLNPAWGTHNTLVIAACAVDYNGTVTNVTAAPSGYSNLADDHSGGTATGAVGLGTASRSASAISSEDPGAFTADVAQDWGAATIMIRPA
jgi:hypothetical protein